LNGTVALKVAVGVPMQVPQACQNIGSHLHQDIQDVDRHPVFMDHRAVEAVEVHHPHMDGSTGRRQAKPFPKMRACDRGPAPRHHIGTIGQPHEMARAATVWVAAQKGDLVMRLKPG
jgi:hypothetical protein